MSIRNRVFKIDTDYGPITFYKRDIGSKGRDILAVKVALGSVVDAPLENSNPFNENTIGKSWFDCTTGESITTMESVEFDENLQRSLMTFQVNHQYSIFAYYFEKIFSKKVSSKQQLLEAISSCLTLVRVETGIIAEATLALLHGWRYNSVFDNNSHIHFGSGTGAVEEITSEILELVQGESAILKFSVGTEDEPGVILGFGALGAQSSVTGLTLSDIIDDQVPSSKRWVSRVIDSDSDDSVEASAVEYSKPPEESVLYSSAVQVTRFLSEQEDIVRDSAYMSESEKVELMGRAFEPNYLLNPDPFVIDNKKLGFFYRTQYSFVDLPPLSEGSIPEEVIIDLESSALSELLTFYNKPLSWIYETEAHGLDDFRISFDPLMEGEPLIKFVELRSPSLRPEDVYRAYFEINRNKLEVIQIPASAPAIEPLITQNPAQQALDNAETQLKALYCSNGASEDEAAARIQYEKYRAFAAKKKLEIARKLKSDLLVSAKESKEIRDIQIDLGIFGQANLTDEQLLVGATDTLISGIKAAIGQAKKKSLGSKQVTITKRLLEKHIETVVENFKKTSKDFENYELKGDPNFDVTVEAGRIDQIIGELRNSFGRSVHVRSAASNSNKSVDNLFNHPETEFKFYFEDDLSANPPGSAIDTVFVSNEVFDISTDMMGIFNSAGEEPKGILANSRTVNYLRNIEDLAGISWANFIIPGFQGSICDENDSTGGAGVSYVLKYTSGVTASKSGRFTTPFHDYTKLTPPSEAISEFVDKATDIRMSNKNVLSSVAGVPSIEYTRSTILPMIGPYCTIEDIQTDFIKKFKLGALLCDLAKCLRLPDINIKIPNFELPDWPDIPTFKFPGLSKIWDELLDLIYQIVRRVLCTIANSILDILSTPFCSDSLIEDLYGAGASQTASAAERALADALTDLGIPKDKFESGKKLIEESTKLLTPRELCALLKGETLNAEVYEVISRLAAMSSINLEQEMNTPEKVRNFFSSLGIYVDPKLCESLGEYNKILGEYTCSDVSDSMSQIRRRISRNQDTTEDEIQSALRLAEDNLMTRAKALELFTNEGSLAAMLPDLMDPESDLSPLNKVPEAILETSEVVAAAMFDLPKMSFMTSTRQYVPSMYLDSPNILGPDDPRYDAESANKSRRAIELLNLFAEFFKDESPNSNLDINHPFTHLLQLESLCTDFEKPTESASGAPIYTLKSEGGIDTAISKNMFPEINQVLNDNLDSFTEDPRGNQLTIKITNITEDLFPILLSSPVNLPFDAAEEDRKPYQSISGWKQYSYFKGYLQSNGLEDSESGELIKSLQDKIKSRLAIIQSDIALNVDKLFSISMGKQLFKIIEDFYDIEAERLRPPSKKLLEYDKNDKKISIKNPTNDLTTDYTVKIELEQGNRTGDNYEYSVNVFDDFFLGSKPLSPIPSERPTKSYTFCEKIPSGLFDTILRARPDSESFPSEALNYLFTADSNLKYKLYNSNQNISEWPAPAMKSSYYPIALEGMMEQVASSIRTSRIFTDSQYIEDLDSRVKGLRYLRPDGCVVNASGFSSLSILNFDELVTKRFRDQFKKELASPLNSPMYRDFSLPGPTEKAIMNTVVLGFIRMCMLEVLLKGAIPFSVWGASFVWEDPLFQKYLEDFVKTQIRSNSIFSETKVKEFFEDTLVRLTGVSNKEAALTRLISEEKAIIIDLARQVFDLNTGEQYEDLFSSEIFPFVDVPRIEENLNAILTPQPGVEPVLGANHPLVLVSDISKGEFLKKSEKSITFFEKYIRLDGPVKMENLTREGVALAHLQGMAKLLHTEEGKPFRDLVDDMGLNFPNPGQFAYGTPNQITAFWDEYSDEDSNPNLEVLSIPEFSDLMGKILNSNPELQKYFAELTNRIYDPSVPIIHMAPKCIDKAPVKKIVRRRGYFKFENEDLFSVNKDQIDQILFDPALEQGHFNSYAADYNAYIIQRGLMPIRPQSSHYRRKLKSAITEKETVAYNGGEKERYYVIPKDATTSDFFEAMNLTEQDVQDGLDLTSGPGKVYNDMFGYNLKSRTIANMTIKEEFQDQRSTKISSPLNPDSPWFTEVQPREIDRLNNPDAEPGTAEYLFWNRYGKVSKGYFDGLDSEEIEYWDETVIDLVFDAAPIYDSIGDNGLANPADTIQVDLSSMPDQDKAEQLIRGENAATLEDASELHHQRWPSTLARDGEGIRLMQPLSTDLPDADIDLGGFSARNQLDVVDKKNDLTYSTFDMGKPKSLSPQGFKLGLKSSRLISRNEITLPVRIYLTQIKDNQGRITQTYFNYDIPSLAEFETSNKTLFREEVAKSIKRLMEQYIKGIDEYSKDISDYMDEAGINPAAADFVNSRALPQTLAQGLTYYNFIRNPPEPDLDNNRIDQQDVGIKLKAGFLNSLSDSESFPSFGGYQKFFAERGGSTLASPDPLEPMHVLPLEVALTGYNRQDYYNFISANKIYSHALHSEVSEEKGNFEVSTAFFDEKFGKSIGALMRKPDANSRLPRTTGRDYSIYQSYYKTYKATSDHDFYGNLSVYDTLERSVINSTINNPVDVLTSDEPVRNFIKSMGNLLLWTRQKRADSVWGRTHGRRDLMFPGTTLGGYGRRGSSEAHPFLCGPSLFHNDGRCMPHEFFAATREVLPNSDNMEVFNPSHTLQLLGTWPGQRPQDGYEFTELDSAPEIKDTHNILLGESIKILIADVVRAFRHPEDTSRIGDFETYTNAVMDIKERIKIEGCTFATMGYTRNLFEFIDFDVLNKYDTYANLRAEEGPLLDLDGNTVSTREVFQQSIYNNILPAPSIPGLSDDDVNRSLILRSASGLVNRYLISNLFPERRQQAVTMLNRARNTIRELRGEYYSVLSSTLSSEQKSLINYLFGVMFSEESGTGVKTIFEDTEIKVGARLMNSMLSSENQDVVGKLINSLKARTCLEERYGLQSFSNSDPLNASFATPEFITLSVDSVEKEIDYCTFYKIEDEQSFITNANLEADANLKELLETPKSRAFFNVALPYKKLASMLTIHSTSMLAGYSQMPNVLTSTKSSLSAVFKMASMRDNFYNSDSVSINPNFNNVEIYNAVNNFGSSDGPKLGCFGGPDLGEWAKIIGEMIKEIMTYFPSYILRGIADKIDPAYKEIKHHYMACNVDNFSFIDGGVLTALTIRDDEVPFGHSPRTGDYAPVNLAFPGDLAFSLARLFKITGSDGGKSLGETLLKLTNYAITGPLPLLDASFAFQIPCRGDGISGDLFEGWSKFINDGLNRYGRYGHPASPITALALSTAVIPGEREDRRAFCTETISENSVNRECDDEE